jgi:gas vesicle protein
MKTGKAILGALAGFAVGAMAGILFAPEEGLKTRRQIRDKADNYVGGIKTKYERLRDSLKKKFERTGKDAERLIAKGKAKYGDAKKV